MPNIQEYTSPINSLRPDEAGPETLARGGRFIEQQYRQAGEAIGGAISRVGGQIGEKIDQHNEMTDFTAAMAGASKAKLASSAEWNDRLKQGGQTGNLDGLVDQQLQRDSDRWDELISNARTPQVQKHLMEEKAANLDGNAQRYRAGVATVSGDVVTGQLDTMHNNSINLVGRDPSQMEQEISASERATQGLVATQKGLDASTQTKVLTETQQKLNENIAKAAIAGLINQGPSGIAQAQKEFDEGRFDPYLGGSRGGVQQYIKEAQGAARTDVRFQQEQQDRQDKKLSEAKASDYLVQMSNPTGQDPNMVQRILRDTTLKNSERTDLVNFATSGRAPGATDAETYAANQQRMGIAPGQPGSLTLGDVFQQRIAGKLNQQDFEIFKGNIEAAEKNPQLVTETKQFNQVMNGMKSTITTAAYGPDPEGMRNFLYFQQDAKAAFDAGRQKGLSANQLLDHNSKDYILRNVDPGNYMVGNKAALQNVINRNDPNAPIKSIVPPPGSVSRNPNETPEEFLKRTGQ